MPEPGLTQDGRLARMWAALAGGHLTDPESRALAAAMEDRFAGTMEMTRAMRAFHACEARRAVQDGALGVIFAGAGIPVEPQAHELAAAASPHARFLYVHPDKGVILLRRAHCGPRCAAAVAGIRDPQAVLTAAREAGLLAPLHVQLVLTAIHWPDKTARETVAAWARLLAAGSTLALSVSTGSAAERPGDLLDGIADVYPHTAESVRSWMEDAGLTVTAGVTPVLTWPLAPAGNSGNPMWQISGVTAVKTGR